MGFFTDFTNAMETYGEDYVTLEVVDVRPSSGDAINEGETASFDVEVWNRGPVRMNDLQVKIEGRNGVLVKDAGAAAPWVDSFVTSIGQFERINAHNGNNKQTNIGGFQLKAPDNEQPERNLVRVTLHEWVGDLDHLLGPHSYGSNEVKAVYRDEIHAA